MKTILLSFMLAVVALSTSAQKTISYEGADEIVRLWDNKTAKHSNYETRDEAWRKQNSIWRTSSCELYIFKAALEKNTGAAIVLYPGGGYACLNLPVSVAKWYASQGITVALVKYRLPNYGHYEATLEDAIGAVKYLRTRTDLGINPAKVGVGGSSAGGHLASWVSNAMADGEKPAFAILHYPWINLTKSYTNTEGLVLFQFLGKDYHYQEAVNLSTHNMVTSTTPPTLLLLCDDDGTVSSLSSVAYYKALNNHGVKASMHIYPKGGHSLKQHFDEYRPATIDWLTWLGIVE